MNRNYLKLFCWVIALFIPTCFLSCEEDEPRDVLEQRLITFEDNDLGSIGYWNGSDLLGEKVKEYSYGTLVTNYYGEYVSGEMIFKNLYTQEWMSWSGFAVSSLTNKDVAGADNIYSVYEKSGADLSNNFVIASEGAEMYFNANKEKEMCSLRLNNSTYTYLALSNGDDGGLGICKKFENGDYFSVTFTGYDINGNITNDCTYYLADFRDGKSYICTEWTIIDISSLGKVNKIIVTFDSSDKGEYGINTPTYVCLDNISYKF